MLGFASTLHSKVAGIVGANLPLPHSMWIWGLFLSVRTLSLLRWCDVRRSGSSARQPDMWRNIFVSLIWPLHCLEAKGHIPFNHGRGFGSSVPEVFFEGLVSCKTQEQSASFPSCHATVVVGAPVSETSKSCCVPTYLGEGCHGLGFFLSKFCGISLQGQKPWGKRGVICWRPVFYSKQRGSEKDFPNPPPKKGVTKNKDF